MTFSFFQLKLGWHFSQELKPPFKNPGSATDNASEEIKQEEVAQQELSLSKDGKDTNAKETSTH